MIQPSAMPVATPAPVAIPLVNGENPLEQRVRRLEDALALIQDTRQLEERVAERVTERVRTAPPEAIQESASLVLQTGKQLLPAALSLVRAQTDQADRVAWPAPSASDLKRPWLLFDALAEVRAMCRMYVDPRYRMTWPARVGPPCILAAVLTSWIWIPGTAVLPGFAAGLIVKAVDLALAYAGYKILTREALRYRELLPDATTLPRG